MIQHRECLKVFRLAQLDFWLKKTHHLVRSMAKDTTGMHSDWVQEQNVRNPLGLRLEYWGFVQVAWVSPIYPLINGYSTCSNGHLQSLFRDSRGCQLSGLHCGACGRVLQKFVCRSWYVWGIPKMGLSISHNARLEEIWWLLIVC